jgi:hypothetical protein
MAGESEREIMGTEEAAEFLRHKPRTLEDWRLLGKGPPYHKIGTGKRSKVLYLRSELLNWVKDQGK